VDELNGTIEHVFVSNKEFTNKVSEDFFLEEVELFGLPYRYGLPKISNPTHQGEEIPTIMLRAPLLPLLSRHYKNYVIYQLEDAYDRVLGRLNEREKMGEQQGLRLKEYDKEVAVGHQLADRVFINNKTIDELVERVADAIEIDFRKT
jgi:guanylate kinase